MTFEEALAELRRDHRVSISEGYGTWECSCGRGSRPGAGRAWNPGNRAQIASDRHLRSEFAKIKSQSTEPCSTCGWTGPQTQYLGRDRREVKHPDGPHESDWLPRSLSTRSTDGGANHG